MEQMLILATLLHDMKIFATTERLILREILPTDVDGMFELDSDGEVHRYLGNKPITTREQAAEAIRFIRQQYIEHGIGRWAVIDKKNGAFMGWGGLKYIINETNGHNHYYDLGYRLIKKYWGQGIATETAKASLTYAFEKLNAHEVYAIADVANQGSNKVLQKVGLKLVETFELDEVEHHWYELRRIDFEPK